MTTFVIRNAKRCTRDGIGRITGFLDLGEFVTLMRDVDNKVNPRGAKRNRIVDAVHTTLAVDPELFWLKSKGLLLSTTNMQFGQEGVERTCVTASFDDPSTEGVMDGGHTMLAVASFVLESLYGNKLAKREWAECKNMWATDYKDIRDTVTFDMQQSAEDSIFGKARIPVDIIYPESAATKTEFLRSLNTICGARNANVQLSATAKLHHRGMYDLLEHIVPHPELFQWKEEQDTGIKLPELTMLVNIPINWVISQKLLPGVSYRIADTQFYSSKANGVKFYESVISHPTVSDEVNGRVSIKHPLILSALQITSDLMKFYDKLYLMFPKIYNAARCSDSGTHGVFGRTKCCKIKPHTAKFGTTNTTADHTYPDGFIIPLIVAASELLTVGKNQRELKWIRKPQTLKLEDFIRNDRQEMYISYLRKCDFNPTTFGGDSIVYQMARQIFKEIVKETTQE